MSRRKTKAPPAPAAPALEVLDLTIGRLRVRCAAAVALDPDSCLHVEGEGVVDLQPGDLLIEEGQDDDWAGAVVVRAADRAELVAVLFAAQAPAAGGGR